VHACAAARSATSFAWHDTGAPSARPLTGVPTKILYKPFYANLPPPALRGPGGFAKEELPILRKNRVKVE